ncbi:MAG: ribosome maturation factor RimP, partial [Candidatus Nanopelagicaceae bacterium]
MSLVNNLTELLDPVIKGAGFVLEEVKVTPAGKRRIIAVIIDGEERNPSLDEVTVVSRKVSDILDTYSQLGDLPFTLEVTTPGVDRPLTMPRHWAKNVGRLVKIIPLVGDSFVSRIASVNADSVTLESREIAFTDIKRAQVEIEFNRKEQR